MTEGPTKALVLRLRAIRKELNLSIADILEKLEEAKTPLSESSVRRVLDHDLDEISGFNYETTIMPIADVLLPFGDTKDSSLSEERIRALLDVIDIKNETLAKITEQFNELTKSQAFKCAKCAEDVAFLKAQIALKDARMDKKDEWIDRLLGHIEEMLHDKTAKTE